MTATFTLTAENGITRKAQWTLPICLAYEFTQNKTLKRPAVWKIISCILSPLSGWLGMQQTCQESALKCLEMEHLKSLKNERCSAPLGLTSSSCSCSLPLRCLLLMHLVCLLHLEQTRSYSVRLLLSLGWQFLFIFNVRFRAS